MTTPFPPLPDPRRTAKPSPDPRRPEDDPSIDEGPNPQAGRHAREEGYLATFPILKNGRTPAVKNWQRWAADATPEKIKNFRKKFPDFNWGLYCEEAGITVIDVDDKEGEENLKKLEAEYGKLPDTRTVKTPHGTHYYFKGVLKSSVGRIAKKIDTRGKGGYVVAPGSSVDGSHYILIKDTKELPEVPEWVKDRLYRKESAFTLPENYLIPKGERNNTLARLGGALRAKGLNEEAIYSALLVVNREQTEQPVSEEEVKQIAQSISRYAPETAKTLSVFIESTPKQIYLKTANTISPNPTRRAWIMEDRYIKGFISVLVAPGGTGKSSLALLDAMAIATGKPLSGFSIAEKGAVWVYNAEDPQEETDRRLVALSKLHEIPLNELSNLMLTSGEDQSFKVAASDSSGNVLLNTELLDMITETIVSRKIVLFIADPFIGLHDLSENDNSKMEKIIDFFRQIAKKAGCSVCLIHHTSKMASQMRNDDPNMARGASSLINAARIAHTLLPLSEQEISRLPVEREQGRRLMKLTAAKNNLQPLTDKPVLYSKESVVIPNGEKIGAVKVSDIVINELPLYQELNDIMEAIAEIMGNVDRISLERLMKELGNAKPHLFNGMKRTTLRRRIDTLLTNEFVIANYRYFYGFDSFSSRKKIKCVIRKLEKIDENT